MLQWFHLIEKTCINNISSPRGWLTDAIYVHERHSGAQRPGDHQKRSGGVPDHPVGPRPDPRALSRPVISFEPPTRRWLTEAINVHEGCGGMQRPGDGQKRSGEVPRRPCGAEAGHPGPIWPHNLI